MDIAGNPIDAEGQSLDPHGQPVDRKGYVTSRQGKPEIDEQRDQVYTERVARRLCEEWPKGLVLQSTHLSAWAAWQALQLRYPGQDVYRLIRLHPEDRRVSRESVEHNISLALKQLPDHRRDCPSDVSAILEEAIRLFGRFHKRKALEPIGNQIQISGELTWYYHNRLVHLLRPEGRK